MIEGISVLLLGVLCILIAVTPKEWYKRFYKIDLTYRMLGKTLGDILYIALGAL
jgi:hypothetical protein